MLKRYPSIGQTRRNIYHSVFQWLIAFYKCQKWSLMITFHTVEISSKSWIICSCSYFDQTDHSVWLPSPPQASQTIYKSWMTCLHLNLQVCRMDPWKSRHFSDSGTSVFRWIRFQKINLLGLLKFEMTHGLKNVKQLDRLKTQWSRV